jgi:hypothetical protein
MYLFIHKYMITGEPNLKVSSTSHMVSPRSQPLANQPDERYILVLGTLGLPPGLTGRG